MASFRYWFNAPASGPTTAFVILMMGSQYWKMPPPFGCSQTPVGKFPQLPVGSELSTGSSRAYAYGCPVHVHERIHAQELPRLRVVVAPDYVVAQGPPPERRQRPNRRRGTT